MTVALCMFPYLVVVLPSSVGYLVQAQRKIVHVELNYLGYSADLLFCSRGVVQIGMTSDL
eukprot:4218908-Amphidinium_carterae.1